MKRLRVLALLLAFVPFPAAADLTGNELLTMCKENDFACSTYVRGYTLGLQRGTIRGLLYDDPIAGAKNYNDLADEASGVCAPEGVTNGQMTDILIKFLEGNPELRHKEIDLLTFRAISQAFPCD